MTSTSINTVPASNSTFLSDLQNFLLEEDADRFRDMFIGFIKSGGTHVTGAGLVHTPDSLVAYPGGHYITETGSITYPDTTTHLWVICHKDTTTAVTDWTRESGTHYLFRNTGSGTKPALPVPESAILMKVTTSGGAVTVVEDHRDLEAMARITGVSPDGELITDGLFHIVSGSAGSVTADVNSNELILESSSNTGLTILSGNSSQGNIYFGDDGLNLVGQISYTHGTERMRFVAANGVPLDLSGTGAVFNENSSSIFDFRVESDLNPFMFFVDAGNNSVHIDNNLLTGAGDGDLVMANNRSLRWVNLAGTTSADVSIKGNTLGDLLFSIDSAADFAFLWGVAGDLLLTNENAGAGILWRGESSSDHSAPAANGCVLYTADNGGDTELRARFNTGTVKVIATEA